MAAEPLQPIAFVETAGGKHDGVSGIAFEFAGDEIAYDDASCASVDDDDVEHLTAIERDDLAFFDLTVERSVCAEEELLSGLTLSVECAGHLSAAERAVGEEAAVFTRKRNALLHALVDNIV